MKKLLLPLAVSAIATPAQALSIVSLHGGMAAPISPGPVDMAIVVCSVLALAGVTAFRLVKHSSVRRR